MDLLSWLLASSLTSTIGTLASEWFGAFKRRKQLERTPRDVADQVSRENAREPFRLEVPRPSVQAAVARETRLLFLNLGMLAVVVLLGIVLASDFARPFRAAMVSQGVMTSLKEFGLWCFYFSVMLVGMGGQYMFKLKAISEFDLQEFVRPLWVSFIVFTPFWLSADVNQVSYLPAAAAYQNGFFWKVVLDKEERKV